MIESKEIIHIYYDEDKKNDKINTRRNGKIYSV